MSILPADRFDQIRYALDPTMDEEGVPDAIIESTPYLIAAEKWVVKTDPLAASRTGDELEAVYAAIIYRTAALLSPAVPQTKQINMAGHNVTLQYSETPSQRTDRLLELAYSSLESYLAIPITTVANAPIFVTTVSGRRG